jgi:hypothetical protein
VIDRPLQGSGLAGLDLRGLNGKGLYLRRVVPDHECDDAADYT